MPDVVSGLAVRLEGYFGAVSPAGAAQEGGISFVGGGIRVRFKYDFVAGIVLQEVAREVDGLQGGACRAAQAGHNAEMGIQYR